MANTAKSSRLLAYLSIQPKEIALLCIFMKAAQKQPNDRKYTALRQAADQPSSKINAKVYENTKLNVEVQRLHKMKNDMNRPPGIRN